MLAFLTTVAFLTALLLLARGLRHKVPGLAKLAIPDAMLAGLIGMALGPTALDLSPADQDVLEGIVYHGLAIVFITVALERPPETAGRNQGVLSMSLIITTMTAIQALVGVFVVGLLFLGPDPAHLGLGMLLPLGFQQGPGQALSLGTAWEQSGLVDGGQLGLIIAALGFLWAVIVGVPLVAWGRRKGWRSDPAGPGHAPEPTKARIRPLPFLGHSAVVALVYAATYGIVWGLATQVFGAKPKLAATIMGFHFVIGALLGIGLRRLGATRKLENPPLARISSITVDLLVVSALSAVRLDIFQARIFPILLLTSLAGVATVLGVLWLARRAFPEAPFEHAIVIFGTSTGTLPTGLTLLKLLDPELRSIASSNAVLGVPAAIPLMAPLIIGLLPWSVNNYQDAPEQTWLITLGVLVAYIVLLLFGWWKWGALRMVRPLHKLWPTRD